MSFSSSQSSGLQGCELNDDEMLDFLAQCDDQEEAREIPPSVEKVVERACHRHERVVPIEETVQALDVREEGEILAASFGCILLFSYQQINPSPK